MTSPTSVKDIFNDALALPAEERRVFLERACGSDAALRDGVERLLAAYGTASDFLGAATDGGFGPIGPESPCDPTQAAGNSAVAREDDLQAEGDPLLEQVIDRYRLLRRIGEGGFGTVYLARQESPVVREVALKIIKAGMDTRQVVRRFESERQMLAVMDYPGIARILDGGTTPAGRPYFVMEYVAGRPITHYCRDQNLALRPRLELFIAVCQAVQHAHQKAVAAARAALGDDVELTHRATTAYGELLLAQGRAPEAETLFREALDRFRRILGDDHWRTWMALRYVGLALAAQSRPAEAQEALERALTGFRRTAPTFLDTIGAMIEFGDLLLMNGKSSEAERSYREAAAQGRAIFGAGHTVTRAANTRLAALFERQARDSEAEVVLGELIASLRSVHPLDEPILAHALAQLARTRMRRNQAAAAEPLLRECAEIRDRLYPAGHPSRWRRHEALSMLGEALLAQGRLAEAEPVLIEACSALRNDPQTPAGTQERDPRRDSLARIICLYESWPNPDAEVAFRLNHWRAELRRVSPGDAPP